MVNKLNIKAYSSEIERYKGSVTANWQSGIGTSGTSGADLITLGLNDTGKLVDSLEVDISSLAAGAIATVRLYKQVNGTEKCVFNEQFIQGTDPDAIPVINSPLGIYEALRVEVQSDKVADNGKSIPYEYTLEAK